MFISDIPSAIVNHPPIFLYLYSYYIVEKIIHKENLNNIGHKKRTR